MRKREIPYKTVVILLILFLVIFPASTNNEHYPTAKIIGKPLITTDYSDYVKLSIDQILTADDIVYVLYSDHRGIIQVFDQNGVYQYTASFYEHMNGGFRMAIHDGILYVRDCVHNIYAIKDGILIEFYEREEAPIWMRQLDYAASSPDYQVRWGSVWCVAAEQEYCFIRRPLSSALYQNNLLFISTVLLIFMIGLYKGYRLLISGSHKSISNEYGHGICGFHDLSHQ